jgi:hypothetical protein
MTYFELLNKYFSSISKLDEENVTLPQFDSKTNNIIHEIHITENEIIDVIQILVFWQKPRLVFIYEIVINKMIVNMLIHYSLH